ncbi:hypothetical protein NPIL_519401 [Nephila pilipes]|uniref:Uncharacterized protein n=1 Tax=Nephila pilipes TaxID=299642 RepID=A0A8X6NFU0_NEPPI|nr:hypothetical protein NPIL_519401 [Nephila pilipes]
MNWRERSAPSSLVQNNEVKRRPHESCKWRKRPFQVSLPVGPGTRKMTRREAADESEALSRRSSPGPPLGATDSHRQVLPGRSSPYRLRIRRHIKEGQEESRRSSPYPYATDCASARGNRKDNSIPDKSQRSRNSEEQE